VRHFSVALQRRHIRSPAQALGNGVLQIRHRRVLASGPGSVSGFLCMCLVIRGGGKRLNCSRINMGSEERFSKPKKTLGAQCGTGRGGGAPIFDQGRPHSRRRAAHEYRRAHVSAVIRKTRVRRQPQAARLRGS
jgi:hypothetical protein